MDTGQVSIYMEPLSAGLPWWLSGKESTCQYRRCGFNPWVRKITWRRKLQPTPVFLHGEFHGSIAHGFKELDMTERLSLTN